MDENSIDYHVEKGAQGIKLNTPAIAIALVDILKSNRDQKISKHTTEWLHCLSQDPSVLLSVYRSNGMQVLVKLLDAPDVSVSFYAVKTLRNLLLGQKGSKEAVCKAGGLQKMVMILKNNNEKFLSAVIDCLKVLSHKNPENRFIIFSSGGPVDLVRIVETSSCKTLLRKTAKVLRILSVCSSNKQVIVAAGGVQALAKHLDNPCRNLVANCLRTLRKLSDAASKQKNVQSLLKILVQLLGSRDKEIVRCTSDILLSMTCNNPYNKMLICLESGVLALVKVIIRAENEEEILQIAICTLCRLTNGHPEAEMARNDTRLHYGLRTIANCLSPPFSWSLIKASIELLRNLALSPNNHEPMLAHRIQHILRDKLHSVYQDILKNRDRLSLSKTQPTIIDGVKMEDIVEGILCTFFNLSQNENVRAFLKETQYYANFCSDFGQGK